MSLLRLIKRAAIAPPILIDNRIVYFAYSMQVMALNGNVFYRFSRVLMEFVTPFLDVGRHIAYAIYFSYGDGSIGNHEGRRIPGAASALNNFLATIMLATGAFRETVGFIFNVCRHCTPVNTNIPLGYGWCLGSAAERDVQRFYIIHAA